MCKFRRGSGAAIREAFLEVLFLAREVGLSRIGLVSEDGTQVDANASRHRDVRYGRAGKLVARLRAEVSRLLGRAEEADSEAAGEDERLPAELKRREVLLARLEAARGPALRRRRWRVPSATVRTMRPRSRHERGAPGATRATAPMQRGRLPRCAAPGCWRCAPAWNNPGHGPGTGCASKPWSRSSGCSSGRGGSPTSACVASSGPRSSGSSPPWPTTAGACIGCKPWPEPKQRRSYRVPRTRYPDTADWPRAPNHVRKQQAGSRRLCRTSPKPDKPLRWRGDAGSFELRVQR